MAKNIVGSIRKVTLAGLTFDVMADTNITEIPSNYENENVPTSGRNMKKMTRRSQDREGVVVACNGSEFNNLKTLAESTIPFTLSYENMAGDTFRAVGGIEFENRETEEGRASLKLLPEREFSQFISV
jgi:hypothetical protein